MEAGVLPWFPASPALAVGPTAASALVTWACLTLVPSTLVLAVALTPLSPSFSQGFPDNSDSVTSRVAASHSRLPPEPRPTSHSHTLDSHLSACHTFQTPSVSSRLKTWAPAQSSGLKRVPRFRCLVTRRHRACPGNAVSTRSLRPRSCSVPTRTSGVSLVVRLSPRVTLRCQDRLPRSGGDDTASSDVARHADPRPPGSVSLARHSRSARRDLGEGRKARSAPRGAFLPPACPRLGQELSRRTKAMCPVNGQKGRTPNPRGHQETIVQHSSDTSHQALPARCQCQCF